MGRNIWSFGLEIGRPDLAEIVEHLYDAALQPSSKKTYKTGQRAYLRFVEEIEKSEGRMPFRPQKLNRTELYLAFYIAYLILRPTIKKGSTILAYEGHVKYLFREQGCPVEAYNTPFLGQLRKGVKNVFPAQADKREAFFLPLYHKHPSFMTPVTKVKYLSRLATVLGFFGMLRPHTFTALGPHSFVFVIKDGSQIQLPSRKKLFRQCLDLLPARKHILGFYIRFKSKTMLHARAYYPNLHSFSSSHYHLCPLRMLIDTGKKSWVIAGFLKTVGKGAALKEYLQELISCKSPVSPYALRIGGRTWNITHGMDRQFVDYLGTWKSPEAAARYYRERPAAVLKKLTSFYVSSGNPEE